MLKQNRRDFMKYVGGALASLNLEKALSQIERQDRNNSKKILIVPDNFDSIKQDLSFDLGSKIIDRRLVTQGDFIRTYNWLNNTSPDLVEEQYKEIDLLFYRDNFNYDISTFILVPEGSFKMGLSHQELDKIVVKTGSLDYSNSLIAEEQRNVDMPSFYMAKRLFSNKGYQVFKAEHASNERFDCPVTDITFEDAKNCAEFLMRENYSGLQIRLPTEEQWEFVATGRGQPGKKLPDEIDYLLLGNMRKIGKHEILEKMSTNEAYDENFMSRTSLSGTGSEFFDLNFHVFQMCLASSRYKNESIDFGDIAACRGGSFKQYQHRAEVTSFECLNQYEGYNQVRYLESRLKKKRVPFVGMRLVLMVPKEYKR